MELIERSDGTHRAPRCLGAKTQSVLDQVPRLPRPALQIPTRYRAGKTSANDRRRYTERRGIAQAHELDAGFLSAYSRSMSRPAHCARHRYASSPPLKSQKSSRRFSPTWGYPLCRHISSLRVDRLRRNCRYLIFRHLPPSTDQICLAKGRDSLATRRLAKKSK
jgi:hypothetical protein